MVVAGLGLAGLLAVGCTGGTGSPPPILGVAARLVSFESCGDLLDWFHDEAGARVTAYGLETGGPGGFGGPMMMEDSSAPALTGSSRTSSGDESAPTAALASSSPGSPGFSMTNVQEEGVGEPDLAVTDGSRLVSVVGDSLRVVDLTAPAPTVTATVALPNGAGQLLVDGDHAVVISGGYGSGGVMPMAPIDGGIEGPTPDLSSSSMPVATARTTLTRIDLDGTPRVVGTVEVDADYVDARMVDGVVRVVTRSGPRQLGFVYPTGTAASEQRSLDTNRDTVAGSTLDEWLPSLTVRNASGDGEPRPAVECAAVDRPEQFSGFDVVTVLGLDLRADRVELLPSAAVVAGAGTVYASTTNLYVTTERGPEPGAPTTGGDVSIGSTGAAPSASPGVAEEATPVDPPPPAVPAPTTTEPLPSPTTAPSTTSTSTTAAPTTTTTAPAITTPAPPPDTALPAPEDGGPYTDVHAFSIGGREAAQYLASGRVRGTVLDQFSLSEHDGRLRIATTVSPMWWGWSGPAPQTTREMRAPVSESYVTVLERDGEELTRIGEVGGLGRNEQIYSTRFVGDQAYVVTFRRTDPLYVVDLRDPSAPRVAGELKINGYSSYLQLIGEGRLLGVGQDGTDTGLITGFAESLFDVTDPSAPTRLAQLTIPGGNSLAEQDHHALLWWDATDTLVVPLQAWDLQGSIWEQGVLVTTVNDAGIVERGRISHPDAPSTWTPIPECPPDANCLAPSPGPGGLTPMIERSLVVGDRLLTVSAAGVMANDLATLTQQSWTPFG